ncbi:hypothetical protein [Neobacillus ginsengisoli]|uniref:Uncharacterized protein n=1 Tax=Neobacillus ginsengisoli TaxID=904295 RepID=A0ABT9XUA3_9BACI|nr:hypothetical protein [Neobacillus ginsengisoli]MDQ0199131.1 hypothetical protein [Neobacillus ginsengisoli]
MFEKHGDRHRSWTKPLICPRVTDTIVDQGTLLKDALVYLQEVAVAYFAGIKCNFKKEFNCATKNL